MKVQKMGNQSFSGNLIVKESVLKASNRGRLALEREADKLIELAADVNITVRKKIFQRLDIDTPTDFVIKVSEEQPAARTILGIMKNLVNKPFLVTREAIAGINFGTFDDPLTVAKNAKRQVIEQLSIRNKSNQ